MCEGVKCAGNVTGRVKSLAGHASRCACFAALRAGSVAGCECMRLYGENAPDSMRLFSGHPSRCACVAALRAGNVTGCEYAVKLSYAWPESCS